MFQVKLADPLSGCFQGFNQFFVCIIISLSNLFRLYFQGFEFKPVYSEGIIQDSRIAFFPDIFQDFSYGLFGADGPAEDFFEPVLSPRRDFAEFNYRPAGEFGFGFFKSLNNLQTTSPQRLF